MEGIKDILVYQNAKINYEKIMEEYNTNPTIIETLKLQNNRKILEDEMKKCIQLIKAAEDSTVEVQRQLDEVVEKIENLKKLDITKFDENDIQNNLVIAEECEEKLKELGTLAYNQKIAIRDQTMSFNKKSSDYKKIDALYQNEYKDKALAIKKETGDRLNEASKKINEAGKVLSPESKAIYDEALNSSYKSNPNKKRSLLAAIFVPFDETGFCRCSVKLGNAELGKLGQDGYVKCPTCGRIVYKDEN